MVTNLEDLKEPRRLPPELRKEFSKKYQRIGDRYTKGFMAINQKIKLLKRPSKNTRHLRIDLTKSVQDGYTENYKIPEGNYRD